MPVRCEFIYFYLPIMILAMLSFTLSFLAAEFYKLVRIKGSVYPYYKKHTVSLKSLNTPSHPNERESMSKLLTVFQKFGLYFTHLWWYLQAMQPVQMQMHADSLICPGLEIFVFDISPPRQIPMEVNGISFGVLTVWKITFNSNIFQFSLELLSTKEIQPIESMFCGL